jgi:hypothetical protein
MNLRPTEVDAFLKYLFTTLKRKPRRLKLHQTAQVARYLHAIVYRMQESRERAALADLAETLWFALSRFAQVKLAEKQDVIAFLQQHAGTYLNSFDIQEIEKLIQGLPAATKQPFRPPALMGTEQSLSTWPARLQDDLTERIFVAYHALRKIEVKGARRKVAEALNQFAHEPGVRTVTTDWGADEVIERVKQFQDRLVRDFRRLQPKELSEAEFVSRRCRKLIDDWISHFRDSVARGPVAKTTPS